ncbi:MAG: FHA domain-containing protein, partial [Anaerolineae bacterium]
MESTGFFDIHIDDPGQEHVLKAEASASSGRPDETGAPGNGYSVRLGWIEGTPYLIDLGSAKRVLVNASPIDPYRPVVIQAGDRITMGRTHLTWNAGTDADRSSHELVEAQAPKVTVTLPRDAAEA